jgi:hypothetical protein
LDLCGPQEGDQTHEQKHRKISFQHQQDFLLIAVVLDWKELP